MANHPVKDLAIAFDIRHATVEGGLSWPLQFQLAEPHLGAVYVKDFIWDKNRKPVNVPLGTGHVDPRFFSLLKQSPFSGPISLHVEYLPKAGVAPNIKALKTDLATLRKLLA
jgi:sugar phosphate isomerase/epimerase